MNEKQQSFDEPTEAAPSTLPVSASSFMFVACDMADAVIAAATFLSCSSCADVTACAGAVATTGVEGATDLPQLPGAYDWPPDDVELGIFAGAANCDGAAAGAAGVTGAAKAASAGAGAAAYAGVEGAADLPQLPSPQDCPPEVDEL